ncbi:hypothetical protein ASJ81_05720 [Methanosarcina spelaei]|uniref:Uncharacterized protein n=1 Tax=Methanosarcina spelaei TaxID=1036679 RepID=A0A2A2HU12_9EURY|nr:hypothetical protein [Methanosarcina spelaei]PAV12770.1 hypothetical protein ASJ81_05720 [Methanosarcina spelaei]
MAIFLVSTAFMPTASAYVSREDSGSDSDSMYLGASPMTLNSYFHGIRTDYVTHQVFVGDGTTQATWYSSSPYYANRVTLNSQVSFSGVTISLSLPSGAGFSSSGSTATYTGIWNNVHGAVTHTYQNLQADGLGIFDEDQSDSATFRFGSTDYTVNTHIDLDA